MVAHVDDSGAAGYASACAARPGEFRAERASLDGFAAPKRAAHMQEAIPQPTSSLEAADPVVAAALRAEAWAGEPFLREGEDPAEALGEGTARRRALDDAVAEMDAGLHGSVLEVEGPLRPPARPRARARRAGAAHRRRHRAPPPPGRRARRDAHRAHRREPALRRAERQRERQRPRGDGGGARAAAGRGRGRGLDARRRDRGRGASRGAGSRTTPAPIRRYRFRHPTASGKTIAAAGFVEAARTLGVLILTHRRLLVSQFTRDLTTEGYGKRFTDVITRDSRSAKKARSRSRPTPGSRATSTRSTATRTSS